MERQAHPRCRVWGLVWAYSRGGWRLGNRQEAVSLGPSGLASSVPRGAETLREFDCVAWLLWTQSSRGERHWGSLSFMFELDVMVRGPCSGGTSERLMCCSPASPPVPRLAALSFSAVVLSLQGQLAVSGEAGVATPSVLHCRERNSVVLTVVLPNLMLCAGVGRLPC